MTECEDFNACRDNGREELKMVDQGSQILCLVTHVPSQGHTEALVDEAGSVPNKTTVKWQQSGNLDEAVGRRPDDGAPKSHADEET